MPSADAFAVRPARPVGRALLGRHEAHAHNERLEYLQMDASLNAEAFDRANGFEAQRYGTHRLSNGLLMGCVKMNKRYTSPSRAPSR